MIPPMGMSEFRELLPAASAPGTGRWNPRRVSGRSNGKVSPN